MDIIYRFNCIIDLGSRPSITFRHFAEEFPDTVESPVTTVNINGIHIRACIDTGSTGELSGTLSLAKALYLPLEDVSHLGYTSESRY